MMSRAVLQLIRAGGAVRCSRPSWIQIKFNAAGGGVRSEARTPSTPSCDQPVRD